MPAQQELLKISGDKKQTGKNPGICLVSLYDIENNATRLLAAIMRQNGFFAREIYFKDWKNNCFDPPSEIEIGSLLKLIDGVNPLFVGISLRSSPYLQVATFLTERIREKLALPVLWGGVHPTLCPEESIRVADMICVGEGERVLPALTRRMAGGEEIDDIPGLWLRRQDTIIRNPVDNLIEDLDQFPFRDYRHPDKFLIMGKKVYRGDPMVTDPQFQMFCSRGCPFHCAYCYNSTFARKIFINKGRYYRLRSVDSVIEELKSAKETFKNLKKIRFDDEVFIFDPQWIEEFCEKYPREIRVPFEVFTEAKLVSEEIFAKLRTAGLRGVYMGIQNTYRVANVLYDRDTPEDRTLEAARFFKNLGIHPMYQVIVDDPMSSSEDKKNLFDLLMKIPRPFELYLFSLTVYPNTALAEKLLKEGKITEDEIEGRATKTFRQYRVSLNYPRPKEDIFWISLLVLITKNFIPKWFIWRLSKSKFLKKHPRLLSIFADFCNFLKMLGVVISMIFAGEMSWTLVRRWLSLRTPITQ